MEINKYMLCGKCQKSIHEDEFWKNSGLCKQCWNKLKHFPHLILDENEKIIGKDLF